MQNDISTLTSSQVLGTLVWDYPQKNQNKFVPILLTILSMVAISVGITESTEKIMASLVMLGVWLLLQLLFRTNRAKHEVQPDYVLNFQPEGFLLQEDNASHLHKYSEVNQLTFRLFDNANEGVTDDFYQTIEIKWERDGMKYAFYAYAEGEHENYKKVLNLLKRLYKLGVNFREYDNYYEPTRLFQRQIIAIDKKYENLIDEIGTET